MELHGTFIAQESGLWMKAAAMFVGLVGDQNGEGVLRKESRRGRDGEGEGVLGRPAHRLWHLLVIQHNSFVHLRAQGGTKVLLLLRRIGAVAPDGDLPCFG